MYSLQAFHPLIHDLKCKYLAKILHFPSLALFIGLIPQTNQRELLLRRIYESIFFKFSINHVNFSSDARTAFKVERLYSNYQKFQKGFNFNSRANDVNAYRWWIIKVVTYLCWMHEYFRRRTNLSMLTICKLLINNAPQ